MENEEEGIERWSERVEDLVASGEVDSAISLLESVVETLNPCSDRVSRLQLASALSELANIYSSKGFSLKAEYLQSRVSIIKHDAQVANDSRKDEIVAAPTTVTGSCLNDSPGKKPELLAHSSTANVASDDDDDWEEKVDLQPEELLSTVPSDCLSGVSNLKLEDTKSQTPKRRGRGKFFYEKGELYSDQVHDDSNIDVEGDETHHGSDDKKDKQNLKYGTSHALVLADFSPNTTTTDLEKLFEDFKNRGFAIRWVNDTVALAVFRTPSYALEAKSKIRCSFTVRILDEEDAVLSSLKARDLEPPLVRRETSDEVARRLIAHSMGLKPSSLRVGSSASERKRQEDIRKERIMTRQKLRDEAWGDD